MPLQCKYYFLVRMLLQQKSQNLRCPNRKIPSAAISIGSGRSTVGKCTGPKWSQNALIPNWILAFARPKWTKMDHFVPFRSANRTLAIPDSNRHKIASDLTSQSTPQNRSRIASKSVESYHTNHNPKDPAILKIVHGPRASATIFLKSRMVSRPPPA